MKRKQRKLVLNRETVRAVQAAELRRVAAGIDPTKGRQINPRDTALCSPTNAWAACYPM